MANGSLDARIRRNLRSRRTASRRLLIFSWIAAVGLPGAEVAIAQEATSVRTSVRTAATAPRPALAGPAVSGSGVSRAIAVEQPHAPGVIAQTSGGVLGNLFGSSASSGSKDDGRRAYPLPPPDPSTVDWKGVPYHAPQPGELAASAGQEPQPIRDVPATNSRRTAAAPAAPTGNRAAATSQPRSDAAAAAARVANATPLPQAKAAPENATPELSTNSSSRRSGRRTIDPLNAEPLLAGSGQEKTSPPQAEDDLKSIPRRQLQSADVAAPSPVSRTQPPTPPADTSVDSPKSLAAKPAAPRSADAAVAPQTRDAAVPSHAPIGSGVASDSKAVSSSKAAPSKAPSTDVAGETPARKLPPGLPRVPEEAPVLGKEPVPETRSPAVDEESLAAAQPAANSQESADSQESAESPEPASSPEPATAPEAMAITEPAAPHAAAAAEPAEFVARGAVPPQASQPVVDASSKQLAVSEMPGIRVVTAGPSEILIRELTQYEVRVENRGSTDASGVVLRTSLPAWAEVQGHSVSAGKAKPLASSDAQELGQLEWTLDRLPAGTVERLFVRIKPTGSGTFDVATNWSAAPQSHTAQVTVREPKLSIQIDGPDEMVYGQKQKYTVRVLNPGDATAPNVLLTLAPAAGESVEKNLGDIAPGKEASFEVELTARDVGELRILGSATADLELEADAAKSVAVAAAKLEATFSGPSLKFQNTDAVYQVQITNHGRATSEAIAAQVRLPAGMKYIGGIDDAQLSGDQLTWTIDSLPPGETQRFDFTCAVQQTGNHLLAFQCEGTAAGRASVDIDTEVQAIADLKLSVVDPPTPAAVGADVTYEVVIHNRGSKAANDVRVIAQFGNGIEPLRVDGHGGNVVTGQVLFDPIQQVEAGEQRRLKIIAKAERAGDLRFRAEVRSGQSVLVAEEATVFVEARSERISRSSSSDADSR